MLGGVTGQACHLGGRVSLKYAAVLCISHSARLSCLDSLCDAQMLVLAHYSDGTLLPPFSANGNC